MHLRPSDRPSNALQVVQFRCHPGLQSVWKRKPYIRRQALDSRVKNPQIPQVPGEFCGVLRKLAGQNLGTLRPYLPAVLRISGQKHEARQVESDLIGQLSQGRSSGFPPQLPRGDVVGTKWHVRIELEGVLKFLFRAAATQAHNHALFFQLPNDEFLKRALFPLRVVRIESDHCFGLAVPC